MKYITGRGFKCNWELGNEPFDLRGLVNWTITGKELAADFKIFRHLLQPRKPGSLPTQSAAPCVGKEPGLRGCNF